MIYLGVDSMLTVLCMDREQEPNPGKGKESDHALYVVICSIRGLVS